MDDIEYKGFNLKNYIWGFVYLFSSMSIWVVLRINNLIPSQQPSFYLLSIIFIVLLFTVAIIDANVEILDSELNKNDK